MSDEPRIWQRSSVRAVVALAVLLTLTTAVFGYCRRLAGAPVARQEGLSAAQGQIVAAFGYPKSFILAYLPQGADRGGRLARVEVWFYPEHQKKITFVAGRIYDYRNPYGAGFWAQLGRVSGIDRPAQALGRPDILNYPELHPQDFDFSMNYRRVIESVGRPATPINFADYVFAGDVRSYLAGQVVFSLDRGRLTYLQILGADKDTAAVSLPSGRGETLNFIANVSEKATRPIGGVAPIGQGWLIGKAPSKAARIFADAKIVAGARYGGDRQIKQIKQVYRDEAAALRDEAEQLRAQRRRLEKDLLTSPPAREEYRKNVVDIDSLVGTLETAALTLDRTAARLGAAQILRLFGGRTAASLRKDAEDLVAHDLKKEFAALTSAARVTAFLKSGGMDPERVIDKILLQDAAAFLRSEGFERGPGLDALEKQLARRLREELEEDREALRDNWTVGLGKILAEMRGPTAGEPKTAKKPARSKIRLTAWVDDLMSAVRGRSNAEQPKERTEPTSGTTKLRLQPSKGNADQVELTKYEALIHVTGDGVVTAVYRIEYKLPSAGSNLLTFTQEAKLAPNIYSSMYSSGWPRQVSLGANMRIKSAENGVVFAEEDKTEENALVGVLTSPTSGSGKLHLTPSLSLDWETE